MTLGGGNHGNAVVGGVELKCGTLLREDGAASGGPPPPPINLYLMYVVSFSEDVRTQRPFDLCSTATAAVTCSGATTVGPPGGRWAPLALGGCFLFGACCRGVSAMLRVAGAGERDPGTLMCALLCCDL